MDFMDADPEAWLKPKFPRAAALVATKEIVRALTGSCERLIIAGSLRRRKGRVGDIEVVYVPKFRDGKAVDLFAPAARVNCADEVLARLIETGMISKRLNAQGSENWGPKNKYATHTASGIPVDFFETTIRAWWGYLVCRTGPAEFNVRLAASARARGLEYHPYQGNFTRSDGTEIWPGSELEVLEIGGIEYLEPRER
jgi:DNA polymerase/3'-5' exonuclease PolX